MMQQRFSPVRRRAQRGIALVEALIAVVILAIGLIGTLGLQLHSQKALADAGMRSEATIAASELIGLMNTDLDHLGDYALVAGGQPNARIAVWHAALVNHLPGATASIAVAPETGTERTAVTIVIEWKRSETDEANKHSIVTYLSRSA